MYRSIKKVKSGKKLRSSFKKHSHNTSTLIKPTKLSSKVKSKSTICHDCEDESTKIYCGRKCKLPQGYTRHGTAFECLQKGIAVGKIVSNKRSIPQPQPKRKSKSVLRSKQYEDTSSDSESESADSDSEEDEYESAYDI